MAGIEQFPNQDDESQVPDIFRKGSLFDDGTLVERGYDNSKLSDSPDTYDQITHTQADTELLDYLDTRIRPSN